jgi:fatty acid desaturase
MTDEERREYEQRMAKVRNAYEQDARGRGLDKKWFVGLVVMWIAIWAFVGTSGILPRPLWVVLLLLMVASAFAVAFLAPRINQSKTR